MYRCVLTTVFYTNKWNGNKMEFSPSASCSFLHPSDPVGVL